MRSILLFFPVAVMVHIFILLNILSVKLYETFGMGWISGSTILTLAATWMIYRNYDIKIHAKNIPTDQLDAMIQNIDSTNKDVEKSTDSEQ